jgi:glycosyltransferase involved in cell wall biosynthesis
MLPVRSWPRRVLMTADPIGGIWTYALDLAQGLQRLGVQTVLAIMGRPLSDAQRTEADGVPGLVLEESAFRLEWMPNAGDDVRAAGDWLLKLHERHQADVVHVNGFAHAALPFQVPTIAVAHSCVLSWWAAVHGERPPDRAAYVEATTRGLHAADAVVAPTRAFLTVVDSFYGPLANARVIHNGRDVRAFRPRAKRDLVFSAGRVWDEAKNVAALDYVAADLPWPVVVAGDWRPPGSDAAPPENVLCLDLVEPARLSDWYAEAPIFALPARYEPFGLAPLEAALSGCALVLGDIPTLREVWGDTALFVPPDDRTALRQALLGLIEDGRRRERMGRAARRRALRFNIGRMARAYLDLYLDAMTTAPPASTGLAVAAPRRAAAPAI